MKKGLQAIVGGGYGEFWRFRGRYRVVKGSRGCKKSKTAALWFIVHLMRHPEANLLVVRKVHRTLKDSCFADLYGAFVSRQAVVETQLTHIQQELVEISKTIHQREDLCRDHTHRIIQLEIELRNLDRRMNRYEQR